MNTDHITLQTIRQVLKAESTSLMHVAEQLEPTLVDIVEVLYKCKNRIVITGIGKSAIVGQKIVATFNSTGTNALFMHAADAIHGDLGMIGHGDVIICISKSGETAEIKGLIPLIKGMGNPLIAMTSVSSSVLAQKSDFLIYLPMDLEADPNNLAPTTSTTLQMAMGDALAIALLNKRGFTADQFAKFHPGGNLGRQLHLRVSDMIDRSNRPKVYLNDSLSKVIFEISSRRYGATAVLDDNENLIGIITDGDLRRMLERQNDIALVKASDIVHLNPKTIQIDAMAVEAVNLLKEYKIQQLIVCEGRRYQGVIHMHELTKEGLY